MNLEIIDNNIIAEANFEFASPETTEVAFEVSPAVGDLHYVHYQDVPSKEWTVVHNLNKFPSTTIVTSAGDVVLADVYYKDKSTVIITFCAELAGKAYLN